MVETIGKIKKLKIICLVEKLKIIQEKYKNKKKNSGFRRRRK